MRKISVVLMMYMLLIYSCIAPPKSNIEFKSEESARKVDVFIDGDLFTSYIYPDDMEKQALYPIHSASGKVITRGFPLNPRPYERTDHPHHVGLWFNFGDVNGLDFWNNSFAVKPEDKHKYGTIKFKEIIDADPKSGSLTTASEWINNESEVLLEETSTYVFEEH